MIIKCEICVFYVVKFCNIDIIIIIFWGEGEGEGMFIICEFNV